jgi:hypothetical protein
LSDPLRGKTWAQIKEAVARGEIRLPTNDELKADLLIYDEASSLNVDGILQAMRRFEENQIRDCLGQWVSELEPCLMYQRGAFVGLGLDGDLSKYPKIYVKAKDPRFIEWRTEDHRSDAFKYTFEGWR